MKKGSRDGNALEAVGEVADELRLSVRLYTRGTKSGGLFLLGHEGSEDEQIDVSFSGPKAWIAVTAYNPAFREEKWCMPADEVGAVGKFLEEVLRVSCSETDCSPSFSDAVTLVLGIDALASRSYTSDILQSRRKSA